MLYNSEIWKEPIEIKWLLEQYLEEHPTHNLDEEISLSLMKIFGNEFFPKTWKKWLSTEQAQTKFVHIFRAILIKYIDNDTQINTNEYLIALSDLFSNEHNDGVIDEEKPMRNAIESLQKFQNISSQLINTCPLRPRVKTIILRILWYKKNMSMKYQPLWVQTFQQMLHGKVIRSGIPFIRSDTSDKTFAQIRWEK